MSGTSQKIMVIAKDAAMFANSERLQIPSPVRAFLQSVYEQLYGHAEMVRRMEKMLDQMAADGHAQSAEIEAFQIDLKFPRMHKAGLKLLVGGQP